jgi:hypothetical protein
MFIKSTGLNHTSIKVEGDVVSLIISLPGKDREIYLGSAPNIGGKRAFYNTMRSAGERIRREDATATAIWEEYVEALAEPDEAMKQAGSNALTGWVVPAMHSDDAWRAMLAASPLGRVE